MDIITTLSAMATAYGYYKASVYAYDTADRTIRFYTFCRNSIGYIRRPIRYYQNMGIKNEDDDDSDDSGDEEPKLELERVVNFERSYSCNDMRKKKELSSTIIEDMSKSMLLFPIVDDDFYPGDEIKDKIENNYNNNENRIPKEVGPEIKSRNSKIINRKKSISMCSANSNSSKRARSKTIVHEDDLGTWVLMKNPDFE